MIHRETSHSLLLQKLIKKRYCTHTITYNRWLAAGDTEVKSEFNVQRRVYLTSLAVPHVCLICRSDARDQKSKYGHSNITVTSSMNRGNLQELVCTCVCVKTADWASTGYYGCQCRLIVVSMTDEKARQTFEIQRKAYPHHPASC